MSSATSRRNSASSRAPARWAEDIDGFMAFLATLSAAALTDLVRVAPPSAAARAALRRQLSPQPRREPHDVAPT